MEFSNEENEKLEVIKGHLAEIKRLREMNKWVESDLILFSISNNGDLDWLIESIEHMQKDIDFYKNALCFADTRINMMVDEKKS